jgi:hypothetical protein
VTWARLVAFRSAVLSARSGIAWGLPSARSSSCSSMSRRPVSPAP